MKKTFLLFFVIAATLPAQIGIGIKGGVPLTDSLDAIQSASRGYFSDTKRYVVGPTFELGLPAGFAIELDMLYTRLNYSSVQSVPGPVSTSDTTANSFEFPLLLKKRFGEGNLRPFVDTGASYRRLWDISQVGRFISGSDDPPELENRNNVGFVIGAGVEIRALFLKISPEVRFTRWGVDNFRDGIGGLLETNKNQGQFLVGLSF